MTETEHKVPWNHGQPEPPTAEDGPRRFPLTDLQAAYMVGKSQMIELGGQQNYYLEAEVVDFRPDQAERARNAVVRRHEHLRTLMLDEGEQLVMESAETPPVRIPVIDLTGLDHERQRASVEQVRERMCEGGLEPTGWPLFEVVVTRLRRHRVRVHLRLSLILLDGSSMRTAIADWLRLYLRPEEELPPVEKTFREWRLGRLAQERGEAFAEHWAYWEKRLDSLPEAPQLPLDRQASSISSVWFTGRSTRLTATQWRQLCANFRAHRVLPSTALLHALGETLGAWSTSPHFCLNFVHQYDLAGAGSGQEIVGQRSATLPVEVDLSADDDFWARAQRLQRQLWRDMAHNDVTAVRVSRELARRRGWTQRAALPYVFTNNQGPGWDSMPPGRPAFRLVRRVQHTPQVLVDNQIREAPDGGIISNLDFVDEAFPQGLPEEIVSAYRRLLTTLAAPGGAERQPSLVPAAHRTLVRRLNGTAGMPPWGRLEDGFLARARAHPEAIAVATPRHTLTYGELEERSRAIAVALRAHGVSDGDLVPVVMVKGWEQVAAVLGVLRSGAAYCPVDAELPAQRVRALIEECDARVAVVQSHSRPAANAVGAVPLLDADLTVTPREDAGTPPGGDPGGLAYVIYTSGSTGRPKGVMIDHRSALNTVTDVNARVGLDETDRVFGISSLSFDLSVWDIFGTLAAGARLVLPDPAPRPDPVAWAARARELRVTVWNSVPALADMVVEVAENRPELAPRDLRAFMLSGDWIPLPLPDRMRHLWPKVRMLAMGGATEASIWSNLHEIDEVDPAWRSVPYGTPLRHQTMRVLDHHLEVRPPWATGQIYIGGAGLARGYWKDDDLTARRFVKHPETGERLYRTGDLGRYWPDGTIEFLGREDRQVKIQGFRVEPGEVETQLRAHPTVRECAVCVEEGSGGQRHLVALFVPEEHGEADADNVTGAAGLTAYLRERLPRYLVPTRIHAVDRLPLTPNGKVDASRALALLPGLRSTDTGDGQERMSPVAERLAALWSEILETQRISADSNFFLLGGDSLLALRMVNRVRVEFGADLPLGRVFEAPTVTEFAALVETGDQRASCMVKLADGPGEELFLFHILGGAVRQYLPLAREWPGPVHAFQSRPLVERSEQAFAPDLETMAATYREELLRHKPRGPFTLGGWSLGGNLAYEVARQLAELGHESSVFMLDSEVRDIHVPLTEVDRHLGFLRTLALGPPRQEDTAALRAVTDPALLTRTARDIAVRRGLLPAEADVSAYTHLKRVQEHELALLAAHRPSRSDQPVLLFVASDEPDRSDPVPAWRAVCPRISTESVPGDHFSLGAQLTGVASRVTTWLANIRGTALSNDGDDNPHSVREA